MAEQPETAVVRQWWDLCMKGDLDGAASLMTADVAHHVPGRHPMAGHYKGRDTVFQMYRRYGEEMSNMQSDLQAVLSDGRGHVISVHRNRYERKGRGIELQEGLLFTVIGGKISDIEEFNEDLEASDEFWSST